MIAAILLLPLALIVSGFFSAAEAALFALGETRVRALVEEGYRGSAALVRLRARPERLLVLLRLGDALCDALAAVLAGYLAYPWRGVGVAVA
ncbi:MAG TPA: DUF21 domain-containing protein, partial [Longimicrobiales bacterium]